MFSEVRQMEADILLLVDHSVRSFLKINREEGVVGDECFLK